MWVSLGSGSAATAYFSDADVGIGARMDAGRISSGFGHGVRTALSNNLSAYGFSVMITASFGVISARLGSPTVGDVFLFVAGAVTAVTVVDVISSKGFRNRMGSDPSDVVALGAALGYFSVGLAVGGAVLMAVLFGDNPVSWAAGPALACLIYLVLAGLEMTMARVLQEDREDAENPEEGEEGKDEDT
jgi:hypothetical protein